MRPDAASSWRALHPERLRSCRHRREQRERRQDRTIANPPRDRGHLPRPRVAVAHPSADDVKTCRTRRFRLRGRFCAGLRRVGSRDRGGVDRRGRIRRRATATGSRQQDQQRQAAPRRRNVPEAGRRSTATPPSLSTRLPVPRGARIPMRGQPVEAGSPRTRIGASQPVLPDSCSRPTTATPPQRNIRQNVLLSKCLHVSPVV